MEECCRRVLGRREHRAGVGPALARQVEALGGRRAPGVGRHATAHDEEGAVGEAREARIPAPGRELQAREQRPARRLIGLHPGHGVGELFGPWKRRCLDRRPDL